MKTASIIPSKACTRCGIEYPATLEFFTSRQRGRYGLASECKNCEHVRQAAYRAISKDKKREKNKQYYAENLEREKERIKKYYDANSEKFRDRYLNNRERRLLIHKQWAQTHPEAVRASSHRRRARVKNVGGKLASLEVTEQYQRQKAKCYYCGCSLKDGYHIEHVVPISRGGRNDIDNVVLACKTCNHRKFNRLPHEWAEGGRLL